MSQEVADIGGAGSLVTGLTLMLIEWVSMLEVNDFLTGLSLAGGLVWMGFKIQGQRLENKIKRNELDELEKDNRDS